MFKSIRKNFRRKNSSKLKQILLCGIIAGSLNINTAFAEDTEENNEEFYSGNVVEVHEDYIIANGERINKGETKRFSINGKSRTFTYNGLNAYSKTISGGSVKFDEAGNNKITINGGEVHLTVNGGNFGGRTTEQAALYGNEFTFNDSAIDFNISNAENYKFNFDGNTFTINGGTHGNSYVSMPNVTSTNNTVNISGAPNLSNAYIYSNYFGDAGTVSGNTLNIYSKDLTAKNIYGFENLNFHLPESTVNGDTILTLTDGATNIANNNVTAYIGGGSTLATGDSVNLLSNSNGLSGSLNSSGVKFAEGVSLIYDANITNDGNNLVMTLGDAVVNEDSKAVAQGIDGANDVVASGTERVLDWLPPEELEEAVADANADSADNADAGAIAGQIAAVINKSFGFFASMDGGNLKTKTGNGSYVKVKPVGMSLGFARAIESQRGNTWVFAPLFDYGKTDFENHLPNGTNGSGNSKYVAGGLIGRRIQSNGFYYEASLRGGKSTTDLSFTSEVLKDYGRTDKISYHASAPVLAGHIRLGKLMRLNRNNLLHVYGIYAHNHINGITADLNTGEKYEFDATDSGTFRLGYRLTTRVSGLSKLYTGLAYQYEFNGGTSAKYKDFKTAESKVQGSSAMLELGWQLQANKKSAWVVDFNVTGWAGMQQGVTATAKVKKSF